MLLRRLADAFRQQDWLTVLVEIMIVVMGVFLGLQVNNWNEWRQDRELIATTDGDDLRADRVVSESIQQILLLREPILKRFDPISYGFQTADPVETHFDFESLAANQEFINLFAHVLMNSRQAVAFNEGHMRKIAALRDKLAQILEIEPGAPAP